MSRSVTFFTSSCFTLGYRDCRVCRTYKVLYTDMAYGPHSSQHLALLISTKPSIGPRQVLPVNL